MGKEVREGLIELLQVAVGTRDVLSRVPTAEEWVALYDESEKQSITGVLLTALERIEEKNLDATLNLDRMQRLQWIGMTQVIEQETKQIKDASKQVASFFRGNGFACTLLKGAAVGRYYPNPNRRQSGDIDIWLDGGRKKIYDFARNFDPKGMLYGVNYHHIHFHLIEGVHVEAHIWPAYMNNPIHNRRFHQFCELHKPVMEDCLPSLSFDRVFILLHSYNHFSGHGICLRQLMDYFYVLKQGFTEEERDDAVYWIKRLGMERFAEGVMWVMKEVFGLADECLLMRPNEKEGRFILQEVMQRGNMEDMELKKTPLSRFFWNLKRDWHLVGHYPNTIVWQPFFSIWLYFWRLSNGLLKDREES